MMGAMMSGRIQYRVEEAALEVGVRMVQQSRDAGVHVVKDDDLVTGPDREHHEGPGCDGEEDVDGVEVRRPEHLEAIQAVMNRVYSPQERNLVRPPVVPVLEEIDEQDRQEQLDEDGGTSRPDVEDPDVVMVPGGSREYVDQNEDLEPVDGR